MLRLTLLAALLFPLAALRADSPVLTLENSLIPSPAAVGARAPRLTTAPDGSVFLIWIEPSPSPGNESLRLATLDPSSRHWHPPTVVAARTAFAASSSGSPNLAATADGHLTAIWLVADTGTTRAEISFSSDRGNTWTSPRPLTRESPSQSHPALAALPDGNVLAAWLDNRSDAHTPHRTQLFARLTSIEESTGSTDTLVDRLPDSDCSPTLAAFPDGSALLTYRGHAEDNTRDVQRARFDAGQWDTPRPVNSDGPQTTTHPIDSPSLATQPGRAAVAWFTATNDAPRMFAATSTNAGGQFFLPVRIDDGHPLGRPDIVLLRDGSSYVSWIENDGTSGDTAIWLRRIAPDGGLSVPVLLATAESPGTFDHPRLALASDYGTAPARLVLACTLTRGPASQLVTRLLTLPPLETFSTSRSCSSCPPDDATLPGFALRGRVIALSPETGTARLHHTAIPGVLAAGEHEFHLDPAGLAALHIGTELLARTAHRDGRWQLFEIRPLLLPAP